MLWNNSSKPQARGWAVLADDPSEDGVVLFGGLSASNVPLNDTWLFRQGSWTELCSGNSTPPACPSSPPAEYGGGMVYDARDSELVLFGDTTWAFHDGKWSNVTSSVAPPSIEGFSGPTNGVRFGRPVRWTFRSGRDVEFLEWQLVDA